MLCVSSSWCHKWYVVCDCDISWSLSLAFDISSAHSIHLIYLPNTKASGIFASNDKGTIKYHGFHNKEQLFFCIVVSRKSITLLCQPCGLSCLWLPEYQNKTHFSTPRLCTDRHILEYYTQVAVWSWVSQTRGSIEFLSAGIITQLLSKEDLSVNLTYGEVDEVVVSFNRSTHSFETTFKWLL